jgi:hypothetical protein
MAVEQIQLLVAVDVSPLIVAVTIVYLKARTPDCSTFAFAGVDQISIETRPPLMTSAPSSGKAAIIDSGNCIFWRRSR